MIEIRLAEAEGVKSREGLEARHLHREVPDPPAAAAGARRRPAGAPVLLIDELDRTDEPFEAYLLEVLADFQVTIPEIGTVKAAEPPIVVITSNRTREIHDAVKRRCLYHWVDYPNAARELEILRRKAPGAAEKLSQRGRRLSCSACARWTSSSCPASPRRSTGRRRWSRSTRSRSTRETINDTLGALLKYQDDIARVQGTEAARILSEVKAEIATT